MLFSMKRRRKNATLRQNLYKEAPPKAVFSYYSSRTDEDKKYGRRTKKPTNIWAFIKHLPVYLASLAIVLCLGYLLTLSTNPKIIITSENKLFNSERAGEYALAAHEVMASSLINQTKITIDTRKLEDSLKERFPEVQEAAITLPIMGRRPIIKLELLAPALIIRSAGEDYILDANGRAIMPYAQSSSESAQNLPIVIDQTDTPIQLGSGVLTSAETRFIIDLIALLAAKDISVSSLTLPRVASELHIKIKNQPYYVKFDLLGDVRLQAGTFLAVKRRFDSRGGKPSQYVDVRVEDKVYYK